MANPRQRRKMRSSSHRPVSHSRNAKRNMKKTPPIRGPKALQGAWDRRKTVKQNYATLGLLHSFSPSASGGTEIGRGPPSKKDLQLAEPKTNELPIPNPPRVPPGFGRIVRDEAGKVISIEVNEEDQTSVNGKDIEMNMEQLEPSVDVDALSEWTIGGTRKQDGREEIGKSLIGVLEQMSAPQTAQHTLSFTSSGVGPRHTSSGEAAFLHKLANKYGGDVEKMAKDRKLNPEQRTLGQLRRAFHRAGFSEANYTPTR